MHIRHIFIVNWDEYIYGINLLHIETQYVYFNGYKEEIRNRFTV